MRHAEAVKNLEGIHGGGNQALTPRGERQAVEIGIAWQAKLTTNNLATLIVAHQPEGRSRYTAQRIVALIGASVMEIPEFAGVNIGVTAGLSDDEVSKLFPNVSAQLIEWQAGRISRPPQIPGSEGLERFAARVNRGLQRMLAETQDICRILLVCTTSTLNMVTHLLHENGTLNRSTYKFIMAPLASTERFLVEVVSAPLPSRHTSSWSIVD